MKIAPTKAVKSLFTIVLLLIINNISSQNIGINGTGGNAHPSALLDVDAIATPSLGILIPRIALQAINVASPVTSPATSLLVYNTAVASSGTNAVSAGYYFWDGIQWVRFAYNPSGVSTAAWNLIGNAGTTVGTNFLGTTDAQDLVFKTNALEAVRINTLGNVGINNTNPTTAKLTVNSSNSAHDVITALHTSGSTTAAFHGVKGSIANVSYTTAAGYLAYHNTSNATYGLYGTGGSFGAVVLNKTYIGNLQPSSIINTGDLEVSNVIGGTNAANLTLRQSTSITTSASDMGYLNFSDNTIAGTQASIRANREQASSGITDLPTALTFHTILDGTSTLTEQMRISNNGYVGIGTSSPANRLTVEAGDMQLGEVIPNVGLGRKLFFSDIFNSSDPVYFQRENLALDNTHLNLILGDNTDGSDKFNIKNTAGNTFLTVQNNGNVGVGDVAPAYKLTVRSFEPTMAITGYFANTPSLTASSATNFHGSWSTVRPNSALNFTGDLYGAVNRIETSAGQTGSIYGVIGATNDFIHYTLANITNARGSTNYIVNVSAGVITNAYGALCEIQNPGGGTITNGYGLNIGTVQATNKWSIYSSDPTAPNYFAANVGIGTSVPTYPLHVIGSVFSSTGFFTSDRRLKQNIKNIENGLSAVKKLKPVSYDWIKPTDKGMLGTQMGFIAQELEEVLPSMVLTSDDDQKTKSVKYHEMLPVLVKAIQELDAKNSEQQKVIENLVKEIELLKQK